MLCWQNASLSAVRCTNANAVFCHCAIYRWRKKGRTRLLDDHGHVKIYSYDMTLMYRLSDLQHSGSPEACMSLGFALEMHRWECTDRHCIRCVMRRSVPPLFAGLTPPVLARVHVPRIVLRMQSTHMHALCDLTDPQGLERVIVSLVMKPLPLRS